MLTRRWAISSPLAPRWQAGFYGIRLRDHSYSAPKPPNGPGCRRDGAFAALFSSSSSSTFARKFALTSCGSFWRAHARAAQLQALRSCLRSVPATAGGRAHWAAGFGQRRAARGTNQVLRLRRAERCLRAAFFGRLGQPWFAWAAAGSGMSISKNMLPALCARNCSARRRPWLNPIRNG